MILLVTRVRRNNVIIFTAVSRKVVSQKRKETATISKVIMGNSGLKSIVLQLLD